jgi:hypothetical protein
MTVAASRTSPLTRSRTTRPARGELGIVHRGPLHRRPGPESPDSRRPAEATRPDSAGPTDSDLAGSTAEAASPPTSRSASGQNSRDWRSSRFERLTRRPKPARSDVLRDTRPSSTRPESRASKRRAGTSTEARSNTAELTAGRHHPSAMTAHTRRCGRRPRRPGKPGPTRATPEGAAIPALPPEGDGAEQTVHELQELLRPRGVDGRRTCRRLGVPRGARGSDRDAAP